MCQWVPPSLCFSSSTLPRQLRLWRAAAEAAPGKGTGGGGYTWGIGRPGCCLGWDTTRFSCCWCSGCEKAAPPGWLLSGAQKCFHSSTLPHHFPGRAKPGFYNLFDISSELHWGRLDLSSSLFSFSACVFPVCMSNNISSVPQLCPLQFVFQWVSLRHVTFPYLTSSMWIFQSTLKGTLMNIHIHLRGSMDIMELSFHAKVLPWHYF